ncbi:hypothetical protein CTRI78_v004281 [Colletotrichum trifolii]|uniref:Uncharacterized protein n=1 Tax=Colletotrichum trifolii TaxID=5466 RepID=A0A4R8RHF6_COLTR|nr:hypothetical protein CTRI78_v004281 [Colletotrichum trifolii]
MKSYILFGLAYYFSATYAEVVCNSNLGGVGQNECPPLSPAYEACIGFCDQHCGVQSSVNACVYKNAAKDYDCFCSP